MNNNPTFRDLLEALKELTDEQLDKTATVYVKEEDEFYPITDYKISDGDADPAAGILDDNHPYFIV